MLALSTAIAIAIARQCDLAYISAGATIICYCLARYVMSECEQNVK